LWMEVKPLIRQHESEASCLVFDDTIIEKQYMDENELACWHWDHSKGRNIKGINILSSYYVSPLPASEESLHIPLAYETVKKTVVFSEVKIRKQKRQSPATKNEMMRQMILQQIRNRAPFKYVLADSWFVPNDNMRFIASRQKYFIFEMKENRLAVTGEQTRNQGLWQNISQLEMPENIPVKVWLKDLDFSVLLIKQVFINKDRSTGTRFLVSNDFTLFGDQFTTIYKNGGALRNIISISGRTPPLAVLRPVLSRLSATACLLLFLLLSNWKKSNCQRTLNHFVIKAKLYMAATKIAFSELKRLKENLSTA